MNEEMKRENGLYPEPVQPEGFGTSAAADAGGGSFQAELPQTAAVSGEAAQQEQPSGQSYGGQDDFGQAAAREADTYVKEEKSGGATIVDFNYDKYADVERKATHTDAVAGLVLGIASIVTSLFAGLIGVILGIIGLVFSIRGRRDYERRGMATAGMVCSIIGMIISVLAILGAMLLFGLLASDMFYYM